MIFRAVGIQAFVTLFVLALSYAAAVAQTEAGVANIVNPDVTGDHDQVGSRTIDIGDSVFQDEQITTGSYGQVQIQLVDGTSMTVGPNSDIVIDSFFYDEDEDAGDMAVSMTEGVLRFVGGAASKDDPVDINTPAATIGIRGGILLLRVQPDGSIQAIFLYGDEMTATNAEGETASVTRQGFMIDITPDGQMSISRAPASLIATLLAALQRQTGEQQADGSRLNIDGLGEDGPYSVVGSEDSAGLYEQTLEDLKRELGLDDDLLQQIQDELDELFPEQIEKEMMEEIIEEEIIEEELVDEPVDDPQIDDEFDDEDEDEGSPTIG